MAYYIRISSQGDLEAYKTFFYKNYYEIVTDTFISQVHLPTSIGKYEIIEEIYEQISDVLEIAKENNNWILYLEIGMSF